MTTLAKFMHQIENVQDIKGYRHVRREVTRSYKGGFISQYMAQLLTRRLEAKLDEIKLELRKKV